jgi:hypothetical protein
MRVTFLVTPGFGIQHERGAFGSPRPIPLLDEGHESIRGSPIATC